MRGLDLYVQFSSSFLKIQNREELDSCLFPSIFNKLTFREISISYLYEEVCKGELMSTMMSVKKGKM